MKAKSQFKILIIAPFFPYPPTDGGKICIYGFIDYLRRYHEFHLLVPIRTYEELIKLDELKHKWNNVIFHIVDETPPRTFKSSFKKLLGEDSINRWVERWKMIMHSPPRQPTNRYDFYSNTLNTFPFAPYNNQYVKVLSEIFSAYRFDIVQTELTPVLNLVHLIPAGTKKIFVQIESREGVLRDYGINNSIEEQYSNYITANAAFVEYSYMSLYDVVFVLNEQDQRVISDKCPSVKVLVSPFALLDEQFGPVSDGGAMQRLIFIGGENHFPNYDGLKWFLTDVAPHFKHQLDLIVTGSWREATQREFKHLYKSIVFTGFVDDLSSFFKNSISIVPIRLGGGGMRTKVLYSMANHSPVVSTSIALTGIFGRPGEHYVVGDSAVKFAEEIKQLLQQPEKAASIARSARTMVEEIYSQKAMSERRNRYYLDIMGSWKSESNHG